MDDVLDRPLGYRVDGRPVWLVRGGAAEGEGAPAAAQAGGGEGASAGGQEGAAGEGDAAEEVEFTPESFQALIDKHNALQSAVEAEREEWREKVQRHSREAAAERVKVRTLSELIGEGATGKPGPKPAAKKTAAATAAAGQPEADTRLAELSAQLEETRRDGLLLGARAALAEAGVPKTAVAKAVRLIDLDALERRGAGEIAGLDEQIAELKETMPQLFTPAPSAQSSPAPAAARVVRAASVVGKGAATRGGEAPKVLSNADKLANQLLYGSIEGPQG